MARQSAVHQFLPNFAPRDAVGNHTRVSAAVLAAHGLGGQIWAENINPAIRREARDYRQYPGRSGVRQARSRLYQASTGSHGMVEQLLRGSEPLAIYYHNITPGSFFRPFDQVAAESCERGRQELIRLAPKVKLALAASRYNAQELHQMGIADVRVMLPYVGTSDHADIDGVYAEELRRGKEGGLDVLFVGRVVPNKGHAHLLRVAAALRAGADRPIRFFAVGPPGPDPYLRQLVALRRHLGLEDCFHFTWSIPQAKLAAHYATADLFLCMSEHEGFGVPLLEAMRSDLPVIAYGQGAVTETLAGAGILLGTQEPRIVAETVLRVGSDARLLNALKAGQRVRVAELDAFDRNQVLLSAMTDLAQR